MRSQTAICPSLNSSQYWSIRRLTRQSKGEGVCRKWIWQFGVPGTAQMAQIKGARTSARAPQMDCSRGTLLPGHQLLQALLFLAAGFFLVLVVALRVAVRWSVRGLAYILRLRGVRRCYSGGTVAIRCGGCI